MFVRLVRLALILFAALPLRAAAAVETLSTSQVEAGRTATVRTVFTGTRIESFEAEILGTLAGGRAGGDIILARATSGRALETGIAQGMSGSPVYVDGKLIGALALAWGFAREPIFGITPIDEMLAVLDHPTRAPGKGSVGPSGAIAEGLSANGFRGLIWSGADGSEEAGGAGEGAAHGIGGGGAAADPSASLLETPSGLTRLALPIAASGLAPGALEIARRWFAPHGLALAAGGVGEDASGDAAELEPGSAIAVDLMRGDLRFTVIGTLTWRDGERLLMFGHPIFQSGEVRLPLAAASITTILPSTMISFKIGSGGRALGTMTQDRRAGVAGRLGESPALMPISVAVRGVAERPQTYRFESIEDRALAPTLVAIAALNSLIESGGMGANQTVRWSLTLHRHGTAPVVLSDVAAGDQPVFETAGGIVAPLAFLYGNPYDALALDSVAVAIDVEPGRASFNLIEARVLDLAVRPGGTARVQCIIERWRGARESRTLIVHVPEEAPEGRYTLWLGGGDELTRYEAKRLPGRYRPTSLEDAWRRLGDSRGSDGIYAVLYASAPEVTLDGRDYPELPLSAAAVLLSAENPGSTPRRGQLAKLDEVHVSIDGSLRGELQTSIEVDAQAP